MRGAHRGPWAATAALAPGLPGRVVFARAAARDRRVLFQRNFVAGEGLRTAGAVRECWVEVGLDSASYDTEIAAAKPVLAAETDRAITEGVYGVPTVTVGDTHFWGDDQLEAAAHAAGSA